MIDRQEIVKAERAAEELERSLTRLARSPAWRGAAQVTCRGSGARALAEDARHLRTAVTETADEARRQVTR